MHARTPGTGPAHPQADATPALADLLDDWITIWQSELAALVLDREMHDALLRLVDGWAVQSRAVVRMMAPLMERGGDGSSTAGPDAPARPAAAPAAPPPAAAALDERDALIQQLLDRVTELERRTTPP